MSPASFTNLLAIVFVVSTPPHTAEPINAVVGDASWLATHETSPAVDVSEFERISTHLEWVETKLRQTSVEHLQPTRRERRAWLLDELAAYRAAGIFPRRTDDVAGRRPVFIDHEGRLCAVGHLLAKSTTRQQATAIDAAHHFSFVLSMNDPRVGAWAD